MAFMLIWIWGDRFVGLGDTTAAVLEHFQHLKEHAAPFVLLLRDVLARWREALFGHRGTRYGGAQQSLNRRG